MINYVLGCILLAAGVFMAARPTLVYHALHGRHDTAPQALTCLAHIRIGGWIFSAISVLGILSTFYFQ